MQNHAKSEEEALLRWSWSLAIQARITSITTQLHTICGQRPKHALPQKIDSVQVRPPHHPQPSAPLPKHVCHSITEASIGNKNVTHPKKTFILFHSPSQLEFWESSPQILQLLPGQTIFNLYIIFFSCHMPCSGWLSEPQ